MSRARLALIALGLGLGLVGVLRDDRRITGTAIVLLIVAVVLRLRARST
jgi:hypothetical protein